MVFELEDKSTKLLRSLLTLTLEVVTTGDTTLDGAEKTQWLRDDATRTRTVNARKEVMIVSEKRFIREKEVKKRAKAIEDR